MTYSPNNVAIYDAAINGYTAGVYLARQVDGPIPTLIGAAALATQASVFAQAIDGAIAPGAPSDQQVALIGQLCQSITANKYATGMPQSTFDGIASGVVVLYNAISAVLQPVSGGGGITELTGDVQAGPGTGVQDAIVEAASGNSDSVFDVTATEVDNQSAAGCGTNTYQGVFASVGDATGSALIPIPANTAGRWDIIISAANATDAGNSTWSGKLQNTSSVVILKAFAVADEWDSTDGADDWVASVSNVGSDIQIQGTGDSESGNVIWSYTAQYASVVAS